MTAKLLLSRRIIIAENAFAEMVLWQVPQRIKGSGHDYKYRLALVVNDACVLRYDNEAGKGDHKHASGTETVYRFVSVSKLLADFEADIRRWLDENRDT